MKKIAVIDTGETCESIPLEALHAVSDIADSLQACLKVIGEANFDHWRDIADMIRPMANRLHEITEEHFPD